jgi:hypothetical protein
LINELAAEIQSSNPDLTPEEISRQIVFLMENEVLPLVMERMRLPKLPSPIDLQIKKFRQIRRRGKRNGDALENKIGLIQEIEKLRYNYFTSDYTYERFQFGDPKDFNQRPLFYPADYWKIRKRRIPIETDAIPPKLEAESFLNMTERKAQKLHELVTFDASISKKIAADPHFEMAMANVEYRMRERFKDIPNASFVFSLRKDAYDPTKEKAVIHVEIPNSSFKEKMNYWLRIDFEVRKTIKSLDFAEAEKRAINRNLVVHVEAR